MGEAFRQAYLTVTEELLRIDDILGNEKLSPVDRVLLIALEREYPQVRGERVPVQIWKLARQAGVKRWAIHGFFVAMHERGYMTYVVRRVSGRDLNGNPITRSECTVGELEPCQCPETLDTREAPRRKETRKKCKERLRCKKCGSENVLVKVVAVCRDCGEEIK